MSKEWSAYIEAEELNLCCGVYEVGPFDDAYRMNPHSESKQVQTLTPKQFEQFKSSAIKQVEGLYSSCNCAVFMITLAHYQGDRVHDMVTKDLGFTCVVEKRYNGNSSNLVSVYVKENPKYDGIEEAGDIF